MKYDNKIGIILSFFGLWINSNFSFEYQQIIGFVVIFLFGILHGANDLALINKIDNKNSGFSTLKILMYYVSVVAIGILLFYFFPTIALLFFLLFSGFHFGEQHWQFLEIKDKPITTSIFQTVYGLFILSLLFYFHASEVEKIISLIINQDVHFLNFGWITSIIGIFMSCISIAIYKFSTKFKENVLSNIFYLLVFAIVFKTADLIWAFAIYFIVWHSLPSIKEQINFLYGDFTLKNFGIYFKAAFPYWLISLIGIALLYFLFRDKEIFNALFFSFLAAITFPHTIIILKMQNKKTASN